MSELAILEELERETRLLASRGDVEHMRRRSYEFTVLAQQRLRRDGWCLLKAPPGGNQINGVRIDKLIHRQELRIVDIIVNADDPDGPPSRPAWQDEGHRGAPSDVVDRVPGPPPPAPPPDPPPAPPPRDNDDLEAIAAALGDVQTALNRHTIALIGLEARLADMQQNGVKVRF